MPDIVTTQYRSNTLSVLLGNGDGSFQDPLTYATGTSPFSVVADDFNGDGFPDVVTANYTDGTVAVLLNDGDWSAPAPRPAPGGRFTDLWPLLPAKRNDDQPAAIAVQARVSSIQPALLDTTAGSPRPKDAATTFPLFFRDERMVEHLNGTELTDLWSESSCAALHLGL
jgi:hypothetical protein